MNTIHISKIVIPPTRQRQEFDPAALEELRESIEFSKDMPGRQLQNAPVLRYDPDQEAFVLVAGERRLKAISTIFELGGTFLHNGYAFGEEKVDGDYLVPYVDIGALDPLSAEEAELDENLKRRDLTWQELADAHARLHKLRKAQAMERGDKAQGQGVPQAEVLRIEQHTIADTAKELHGRSDGSYQDTLRKEVIIARHLDNPAVAKAKTMDEAFKVLKQQESAAKNVALAASVGATFNSDLHQVIHGDCLEYMTSVAQGPAEKFFDVICTDPPYGMGADDFGDGAGRLAGIEHEYDDSYEAWIDLMDGPKGWCNLSFQVCKPQAHAYVFCDIDRFHELKSMMQSAGWYVFRTPMIVHKLNSGRVPLPDRGPRRQYEIILYAIKGNKPVTHIYPDVIPCSADENTGHGAQKPVALFQNLLQRSVRPGDRIADFFAGSGPIFPAGHQFKCTVVGIEKRAEYYGKCLTRVKQLKSLETPSALM